MCIRDSSLSLIIIIIIICFTIIVIILVIILVASGCGHEAEAVSQQVLRSLTQTERTTTFVMQLYINPYPTPKTAGGQDCICLPAPPPTLPSPTPPQHLLPMTPRLCLGGQSLVVNDCVRRAVRFAQFGFGQRHRGCSSEENTRRNTGCMKVYFCLFVYLLLFFVLLLLLL